MRNRLYRWWKGDAFAKGKFMFQRLDDVAGWRICLEQTWASRVSVPWRVVFGHATAEFRPERQLGYTVTPFHGTVFAGTLTLGLWYIGFARFCDFAQPSDARWH